jgi:hypothetical protein
MCATRDSTGQLGLDITNCAGLGRAPLDTAGTSTVKERGVADRRLDRPEAALAMYPLNRETYGAGTDVLVRRSVFEAVGGFEERFRGIYRLYEDHAFLIKVYLHHPVYISSRVWRHYRQHAESRCEHTTERE